MQFRYHARDLAKLDGITLRQTFTVTATLLCMALLACADAPGDAADAGIVRFGTSTPLITFDPHLADTGPLFSTYLTLVYDGLTRVESAHLLEPQPALAESWRWLDETTVEFRLRPNVRFFDGHEFNAEVAKLNLERMLGLKGPRYNTVSSIREVEAIDPLTLRVALHFPDPTLLLNLAISPGMMVSPDAFDNPDLDLDPVGTGPWRYERTRSTLGEIHRFTPNEDYFDPRIRGLAPYEIHVLTDNRARLNALVAGQIDLAIVSPTEAKPADDLGFDIAQRANRWFGLTILDRDGTLVPELADARVRRALGYAVDRQALADVVFFGYARPASQPIVEDVGHVPALRDYYRYDPARSRELLDAAGVERFSFKTPILANVSAEYEALQAYFRRVGIDMELEIIEPGTVGATARTQKYPVNTIGYPNFDPDARHMAIWDTKAAFNPFHVVGARTDELAERARRSLDEDERRELFTEYFNILVKDVYSVVFLQLQDLVAYDGSKLAPVPVGRYIDPMLREIRINAVCAQQAC